MRLDEELSYAELAKRLNVNEETARRRVRRAEKRALNELAHEKAVALQKHTLRLERLRRRGWRTTRTTRPRSGTSVC
jgi:transposase